MGISERDVYKARDRNMELELSATGRYVSELGPSRWQRALLDSSHMTLARPATVFMVPHKYGALLKYPIDSNI